MTLRIPLDRPISLPPVGTWPEATHLFDADSAYAVESALAAGRPLLVRGEPGTGKSQLARAAAAVLGRALVAEVLHARSEGQELQYRFDAVARLGEAQALDRNATPEERAEHLAPRRFLSPGPLWWVFDWGSAERQYGRCVHRHGRPERPDGWEEGQGSVLLIDEIDKADADLPNGLLETLGNGAFSVPYLEERVGLSAAARAIPPLVVVTTNEERELPAAFVRRCLVLHLPFPDGALLKKRAAEQPDIRCGKDVMEAVLGLLLREREVALDVGATPPGQAEYLDILRALTRMSEGFKGAKRDREQERLVGIIHGYFFRKFAGITA